MYERYEYQFQKGCDPQVIASHLDSHGGESLGGKLEAIPNVVQGVQFNIQTFKSFAIRKYFISLIGKFRYGFVCLQEARDGKNQIKIINNCVVCCSAGSSGTLGCEVSINLDVPWYTQDSRSVKINSDCVTIVHAVPRVLIVCICNGHMFCYVISAHAPHVGCKEPFDVWWIHFQDTVTKFCKPGCPIVVGIDANYRCHRDECAGIGDLRSEQSVVNPKTMIPFVKLFLTIASLL